MAKKSKTKDKKSLDTNKSAGKAERPKADSSADVDLTERPSAVQPLGWMGDWMAHWPALIRQPFAEPMDRFERLLEPNDLLRVEETIEDDDSVIRIEIPGVDPDEDIDVKVAGGRLLVSARRERRAESKGNGYRSEFQYGTFHRSMPLSPGVDAGDVEAKYTDGILEIRVPIDSDADGETTVSIRRAD